MVSSKLRLAGFGAAVALALGLFAACGSDDDNKKEETNTDTPTTVSWSDANTVIKASCSAAACHGKTSPGSTIYEDNQANFEAAKTKAKSYLALAKTDPLYMPRDNASFSTTDRDILLNFLDGK